MNVNDIYSNTLFASKESIIGNNIQSYIAERDKVAFQSIWENVRRGNRFKGESRRVDAKGAERWFLTVYAPSLDSFGHVQVIYYLGLDITEKKRLELATEQHAEEVQRLKSELEADFAARTQDYFFEIENLKNQLATAKTTPAAPQNPESDDGYEFF